MGGFATDLSFCVVLLSLPYILQRLRFTPLSKKKKFYNFAEAILCPRDPANGTDILEFQGSTPFVFLA
jgi:hypothetical protein